MTSSLRARREALGLSQAEIAGMAGLSRQQISAVESGRHSPSVAAALALARCLDTTVESLFGSQVPPAWESVTGEPSAEGAPVVAASVGDRAVFHPLPRKAASADGWRRSDGIYLGGDVRLFGPAVPEGAVIAGCDPIVGLAAGLLPSEGAQRLTPVHATSVSAARALHRDRVHAAVVHGTEARLSTPTPRSRAIPIAAWRVGLAARKRKSLDLDAISTGTVRVAHRPVGAEAERALRNKLAAVRDPVELAGPVVDSHFDAASSVDVGAVEVGLTIEPLAQAFGLEFLPLEVHRVELRVDDRWVHHPGIVAAVEVFGSKRLADRVSHLDGYELLLR